MLNRLELKKKQQKKIPLEYKRGGVTKPYRLSALGQKYGTAFVWDTLGFQEYTQKLKISSQLRQKARQAQQDLSAAGKNIKKTRCIKCYWTARIDKCCTADRSETVVKTLGTSFIEEQRTDTQPQTEGLTLRELQGLDKVLQHMRGELVNNLAKLTELDKDISKEKRKLQAAEDEISKRDITARLKTLEDEKTARLEAASANKEALRSQISMMTETINKVLKEDTTLREKLKILFRD